MTARQDLTEDRILLEELLAARRGTAVFGRKLQELSDDALYEPSLLACWTRAHVVAHVGYNARSLARLMHWANTGEATAMYSSPQARNEEIEFGATLNAVALRTLHEHSAIHLNVDWRDTPAANWGMRVKTAQGRTVPASETVWMRTREVWLHAVDLANGATFEQIPFGVLQRLLNDITTTWKQRGSTKHLVLEFSHGSASTRLGDLDSHDPQVISGSLPAVAAWAAFRPCGGIRSSSQDHPLPAPRWI